MGFCARGSLILLGPPAARADSPAAGALWLWTRRLSNVEVIVEEATDLSLVGDWRVDPTLRMLSSRDCCCCQGGNIDEKVVVVVDSCATGDVVTVDWKSCNEKCGRADAERTLRSCGHVHEDQPRGLVVRASGYKSRGPGFDSRLYHGDFPCGGGSPW